MAPGYSTAQRGHFHHRRTFSWMVLLRTAAWREQCLPYSLMVLCAQHGVWHTVGALEICAHSHKRRAILSHSNTTSCLKPSCHPSLSPPRKPEACTWMTDGSLLGRDLSSLQATQNERRGGSILGRIPIKARLHPSLWRPESDCIKSTNPP